MWDAFCYLAFVLGVGCLLVGLAALSPGLLVTLAVLTILVGFFSLVQQFQATDKSPIGFGLSGIAIVFAIVGVWMGFFGTEMKESAQVDDTKALMQDVGRALQRYKADNNRYPPWASGSSNINYYRVSQIAVQNLPPSFRTWVLPSDMQKFPLLTTPIAYINDLPVDPYMEVSGATFSYYQDGAGWLLLSPGPDYVYDIIPEQMFNSSMPQPSLGLVQRTYDPTNGVKSSGDIYEFRSLK